MSYNNIKTLLREIVNQKYLFALFNNNTFHFNKGKLDYSEYFFMGTYLNYFDKLSGYNLTLLTDKF